MYGNLSVRTMSFVHLSQPMHVLTPLHGSKFHPEFIMLMYIYSFLRIHVLALCMISSCSVYTSTQCRYKTDVSGLLKSCFSSGSPPTCLREYITYIHSLDYYTTPNYHKAKQMFTKELSSHGFKDDGKNLDWFIPRSTKVITFGSELILALFCLLSFCETTCCDS